MRAPSLNLSEWLRRMGVRPASGALDVHNTIQPVQVVSDASALVSPLLPPSAFAGSIVSAGGVFQGLQLQAVSAGGIFVRYLTIATSVASSWGVGLIATPLAGGVNLVPEVMEPGVLSMPQRTSPAAATLGADTAWWIGLATNGLYSWVDAFYIPPGQTLLLEASAAITGIIRFGIAWSEVPVD